jgi:hypothetical protein
LFRTKIKIIVLTLSLASIVSNVSAHDIPTGAFVRTVIKKEQDRATTRPRIPKNKLFRSNPLRKSLILGGTDPWDTVDDEDVIANAYRRPIEPNTIGNDDDELSDHVKFRLWLARQLALKKYYETRA